MADSSTAADYTWTPPVYDTSRHPTQIKANTSLELLQDPDFHNNFARTVKWCPDGSTILLQCENRSFQLLDPSSISLKSNLAGAPSAIAPALPLVFPQPAPILDFAWFPSATSSDPASYCFVASVRDGPIRLLDATDGRLRASYSIVDHRERHVAPHCIVFGPTAERLYAGFDSSIEVFDVARPGSGTRLRTTPTKASRDGLKGIISSIAFPPLNNSTYDGSDGVFAVGSLTPTEFNIALFDAASSTAHDESGVAVPLLYLGGGPTAGVTQLAFHPTRPHLLLASFRRQSDIYCWDIRGTCDKPVGLMTPGDIVKTGHPLTNQKNRFELDSSGRWLGVGDQRGNISMFNLDLIDAHMSPGEIYHDIQSGDAVVDIGPTLTFRGHSDSIGSVAFNPIYPVLLSASGSRDFDDENSESSHSDSENSEEMIIEDDHPKATNVPQTSKKSGGVIRRLRKRQQPAVRDDSVRLWNFGMHINE